MSSSKEDRRALILALAVYAIVFVLKLAVFFSTGVMALLAETLHTLSDIFISAFLLVATIWSQREADRVHMFGYGRAQNVAALVAATLFISFTSLRLYEESIPRLFSPAENAYQNLSLAFGVIVLSMIIASIPLFQLYRQKKKGSAAKAQFMESINDELGLLAALIGTLFISWGYPVADPVAAIIVATIIAINAVGLFRENLSFLIGRSPGPEFLRKVETLALSVEGVTGVHDIRAEYIGPDTVHVGMHIEVPRELSIDEANLISEKVHEVIQKETRCRYCVIHVDPSEPRKATLRA